jgi:pentatricopeptide repeat protein
MAAQLRRRDYGGVAATASKLPSESLTPKMLAILAIAAASRKELDEVLRHLRRLPVGEEGSRCALSASGAGQILMLATKEQRTDEVKAELQRIGAQIKETKGAEGNQSMDVQRSMSSIKAFARNKDLQSATAVFDRLKLSGVSMRPQLYNCYLDACVQCGSTRTCLKLFEEMKQLGCVDVVSYNTTLKAYLASNRMEDARALVKEMTARGLPANKVTYNELLNAKVASRDHQGMWAIVDEMLGAGLKVNLITCSILLKSLSERSGESDVTRVMALVDDLEESIDEVLFSSTVEACIRIKQLGMLSQFIDTQKSKGIFKSISAPIFGAMMKAFGHAGNVHQVRDLWAQMQENQVKPTAITIGCVVEALVINRRGEEAWQLVQEQLRCEDRKSMINTVVYSTVLKGFAVSKRIDKVLLVYKEMRSNAIACNTITYNTMLDACAKCNAMEKAAQLLEDMKELNVEPDIITYSTIIKGYCMCGEIDLAFSVMKEMKSDGHFEPDEIMYNSILDGCARQRQVTEALKILDEMQASGIRPSNYTLSILVKLLGSARRLGQALQIVEDLSKQHGLRPNIQVYTCMIHACFQNKRFERALSVYESMIQEACRADEKFYSVLARGCLQLHHPSQAIEVIRAAYKLPSSMSTGPGIVGVEGFDELCSKLRASGEQAAVEELTAELDRRGLRRGGSKGGKAPIKTGPSRDRNAQSGARMI